MGLFDFFSKKEVTKDKDYPHYLEMGNYGTPRWSTQKDYEYIKEGFNKLVWIYTCATLISSNVSKVKWEVWRMGKGKDTKDRELFEHPILDLLNGNINSHFSSKDFFELWALGLALQGKFYCKMNSPMFPTKLYPLYPHKTKPIPHKMEFVSGFEFDTGSEKEHLKQDEVLWSKFNDPLDYYEGLSPIKAMARTVDTENEAVDWNKSQLQNQAVPPGAIQVQNPSPEMTKELRKEWLKRYAGPNNARVPLILNSEKANYISFGLSPVDMDFLNQRKLSRIEICAGFKVPSQVAGDPDGQTYSNYNEAVKSFWNQCLIPDYLDRMKDDLNLYIAKRYNENLEIRYSLDDIGALHEALDSKNNRAVKSYKAGLITKNEGRAYIDHDEVEDGDKFIENPSMEDEKEPAEDEKSKKKKLLI